MKRSSKAGSREAGRIDPIMDPVRLSKILQPNFSAMPDERFERWVRWTPEGGGEPLSEAEDAGDDSSQGDGHEAEE